MDRDLDHGYSQVSNVLMLSGTDQMRIEHLDVNVAAPFEREICIQLKPQDYVAVVGLFLNA
jgi:hypothetical protein